MLSDAELRVLRALAEALIPPGGPFPLGAGDVGTAERLARHLQRMAPETQGQVRLLLHAWAASPLSSRNLRRFSRLAPAARDAWVERCLASRLPWRRIPLLLLKTLCLSAFCADPRVEAALGYGHECLDGRAPGAGPDRKSTRLNSSHRTTSYAVFCLKKKTSISTNSRQRPASVRRQITSTRDWLRASSGTSCSAGAMPIARSPDPRSAGATGRAFVV